MKEMNRREFLTLTGAAVVALFTGRLRRRALRASRTHYVQRSRAGGSHQQGLEEKSTKQMRLPMSS